MNDEKQTKKIANIDFPLFTFGTWLIGGGLVKDENFDESATLKILFSLLKGRKVGIDCAELYGGGYTEQIMGKVLRELDRDDYFIISKVEEKNFSRQNVLKSCRQTLDRLGIEKLDLYLLHKRSFEYGLEEAVIGLNDAVDLGLTKYVGVCNFGVESLKEAQKYSKNKIVYNQVHYNLIFREPEFSGLLDYCVENDICMGSWRSLERGKIAEILERNFPELLLKYESTGNQLALGWLLSQKNVVVNFKTLSGVHFNENILATEINLEKADVDNLTKNFPNVEKVSYSMPLK